MKSLKRVLAALIVVGLTAPVFGADIAIHGDFNNRFMVYTDQSGVFAGAGEQSTDAKRRIKKDGVSDSWGEIKYRLWVDAATNDNKVKAIYAIELGALHFGKPKTTAGASQGGEFSGDAVNIETRWAYTDFQLPGVENKARFRIGLQPMNVNYYLWKENAMGVNFVSELESLDYQLAWIRGYEHFRDTSTGGDDVDALLGRLNFKGAGGFKIGVFGLYMTSNAPTTPGTPGPITATGYQVKRFADVVDLGLWNVGVDGSFNSGDFFINYDLIYQGGDIENVAFTGSDGSVNTNTSVDVSAYFAHADIGFKMNDWKATYTFWYASGDDNPADQDFEGFVSVDVDSFDGVVLFESFTDDNYFTERHHLLDKGFIMNKIAIDYQATPKLKVGAAGLYMLTAEDIKYTAAANGASVSESTVGFEIDAYFKYMLFKNVEVAMEAGYLWAGDAMDFWEESAIQNGSADEDIMKITGRVRYKF
ncbi:MAG: hypothetical protein OET07_15970 [Desulfobacteraceae bacterium]|nr:hypothetical protein [Desulfobacteraceae bacterium]MDH3838818.1 hypothetical protein [Desulfobacteraceae bacterium]MDH3875637.1 hypothetical protein [Desulfobacteraceae bacterium]